MGRRLQTGVPGIRRSLCVRGVWILSCNASLSLRTNARSFRAAIVCASSARTRRWCSPSGLTSAPRPNRARQGPAGIPRKDGRVFQWWPDGGSRYARAPARLSRPWTSRPTRVASTRPDHMALRGSLRTNVHANVAPSIVTASRIAPAVCVRTWKSPTDVPNSFRRRHSEISRKFIDRRVHASHFLHLYFLSSPLLLLFLPFHNQLSDHLVASLVGRQVAIDRKPPG